jgi:hypothetical protein
MTPAFAGPPPFPLCCACLVNGLPPAPGPAFFCEEILSSEGPVNQFEAQCNAVGGGTTCVRKQDGTDCKAQFAGDEIICHRPSAPAPVLGASVLTGLALALAGLGAWAVRNRSTTRHPC